MRRDMTSGADSRCACEDSAQPLRLAERRLLCVGINALAITLEAADIIDRRRSSPAVSRLADRGASDPPRSRSGVARSRSRQGYASRGRNASTWPSRRRTWI
jgi:hypothetical protein